MKNERSNESRGSKNHDQPLHIDDILTDFLQHQDRSTTTAPLPGVLSTGLLDLDVMIGGLQPGSLHVVCGESGVGKTAFATQVATQTADEHLVPVLFVTGRSGSDEIVRRFLASRTQVDLNKLRLDELSDEDRLRLAGAARNAMGMPLFFLDGRETSLARCVDSAKLRHEQRQLGLIVVDDMPARPTPRAKERLKVWRRLAKGLDVPMLITTRSRECDDGLSLGRGTKSLERETRVFIALRRDERHEADSEYAGLADFHVVRHQDGPTGIVVTRFSEATGTFRGLGEEK